MNIDFMINDLIINNKEEQISSYIDLCKNHPDRQICSYVDENNRINWFNYLSSNDNKALFSKGRNRLQSWVKLLEPEPILYFSKQILPDNNDSKQKIKHIIELLKSKHKFFILAGLIIIFQVFGDGNHRTAEHFYKQTTGKTITLNKVKKINNLLDDYNYTTISNNPIMEMDKIVTELYNISSTIDGGRKRRKTRKFSRPKLTRSIKSYKKNKIFMP